MNLDKLKIQANVDAALLEDVGSGDVTAALIPTDAQSKATILNREPMLLCGKDWVEAVFSTLDKRISIEWLVEEGAWVSSAGKLCNLHGPTQSILTGERSALNFLQTLSATATQVYKYIQILKDTSTRLLDTRKTIPGLRYAQKYAVHCAGGVNHRFGLYDAFLIKENHIKACGSIMNAVNFARRTQKNLLIEVEVENLVEFEEALASGAQRIMLDNFSIEDMTKAVGLRAGHACEIEASGGIELENIKEIAMTGVDFISVGAVTKSIRAIDLSLLIVD